jgi:hypothetical protein
VIIHRPKKRATELDDAIAGKKQDERLRELLLSEQQNIELKRGRLSEFEVIGFVP